MRGKNVLILIWLALPGLLLADYGLFAVRQTDNAIVYAATVKTTKQSDNPTGKTTDTDCQLTYLAGALIPSPWMDRNGAPLYKMDKGAVSIRSSAEVASDPATHLTMRRQLYQASTLLSTMNAELTLDPLNADLKSDRDAQAAIVQDLRAKAKQ